MTPYTTVLDALPLWALFPLIVVFVLLSIDGGYRLGRYRHSRSDQEKEAPVGAMVGSSLGLLAFMLAFTFSMAASRFDARKALVLEEANAIGTTYLRAAMLPAAADEVRGLLRDYVDVRLAAVKSGEFAAGIQKSEALQNLLWAHAVAAGQINPNSIVVGLYIESLNEVIDLHSERLVAGLRNRIPGVIWLSLSLIAVLSLGGMGYHQGLTGTARSGAAIAVALVFSAVFALVVDLDRPQEGSLVVSQQPLIDVRQSMNPPTP